MKTARRSVRPALERLESRDTPAFTPLPPFGKFGQVSVVASADLNGDGFADFAVGQAINTLGTPSVSILLGKGDGTFTPLQEIVDSKLFAPQSLAIADVNGDGRKDLIVGSFDGMNSGSTLVLLGQADGSFGTTTPAFFNGTPTIAVGVADFTGDGLPDIVAIHPAFQSISGSFEIYAGTAGGTFSLAGGQKNLAFDVNRVAVADFDKDGHQDFVAFDGANSTMFRFYGDGTGAFALPATGFDTLPGSAFDGVAGDFNGDGLPDLVLSITGGVTFLKNLGGRQFDLVGVDLFTFVTNTPPRLASADFNGDGVPDVVATDPTQARVFLASAAGFTEDTTSPLAIPGTNGFDDVATGDANGDGNIDFIVGRQSKAAPTTSDGRVFLNLAPIPTVAKLIVAPNPGTEGVPATLTAMLTFSGTPFPAGVKPSGTVAFDVDGVFLGNATVTNDVAMLPTTLPVGTHTVLARYLGDANFKGSISELVPYTVLAAPTRTFQFEVTGLPTLPGLGADRVASGNFTADGVSDIALASGPGRPAEVSLIDGKTRTAIASVTPFGDSFTGGLMVAAGDIDGDGVDDLAVAADIGGGPRVTLYLNRNGQLVETNNFFALDENFRGGLRIALGDLDGDHHAELIVTGGPGAGPRVATYDGRTLANFHTPQRLFNDFFALDPASRLGMFVAVGDLNGDGHPEIAVSSDLGGGPRVLIFDGASLLTGPHAMANFFAGNPNDRGGLRIAIRDVSVDPGLELIVGDGPGAGSTVRVFSGLAATSQTNPEPILTSELMPGFLGGVFVA